jgi:hypothetical protein
LKASGESQRKSQGSATLRCYSPDYGDCCAPWARRRFGLPRCRERHLGGCHLARLAPGRTKTEVRDKLKKLQAEADAGLKTSASYTVAKAVDDWAAEALDGLADKTVRSHVDLLRPVTMLIGNIPLRDLTAHDVRRALNELAKERSTRTMASTPMCWCGPSGTRRLTITWVGT